MVRKLSNIIDESYADIQQGVQYIRHICNFAWGIKQKALSAETLGFAQFADEYFLKPELYNLDARPVEDAGNNLKSNTVSFYELIGIPACKNEYARDWVVPVDYVLGDVLPAEFVNVHNRYLVIDNINPAKNGIYVSEGEFAALRVDDAKMPQQLEFCSVYVNDGQKYGGKCFSQVLKINRVDISPQMWLEERYATPVLVPSIKGITVPSGEYNAAIDVFDVSAAGAQTAATTFLSAVNSLKTTTTTGATISACDAVLELQTPTIDAFLASQSAIGTIENIDNEFDLENMMVTALNDLYYDVLDYPNGERIITSLIKYYIDRKYADASSRRKAFQIFQHLETGKLEDKYYNPNSTRPAGTPAGGGLTGGGGGDAGDKIAQALVDMNAMNEYWAQLGWATAEKANKNNPHVRQLEQVLRDKNLEELVTAHDKAVDPMLSTELNITPPDKVNLDLSPLPPGLNRTPPN